MVFNNYNSTDSSTSKPRTVWRDCFVARERAVIIKTDNDSTSWSGKIDPSSGNKVVFALRPWLIHSEALWLEGRGLWREDSAVCRGFLVHKQETIFVFDVMMKRSIKLRLKPSLYERSFVLLFRSVQCCSRTCGAGLIQHLTCLWQTNPV